jgi:hypothetical protein
MFGIANPEYEPEDMLRANLHALASSEATEPPFLVALILQVWEDTLWNSASNRGKRNMETLLLIPTRHMRFVPVHKQRDDPSTYLAPAICPVELILISIEKVGTRDIPRR